MRMAAAVAEAAAAWRRRGCRGLRRRCRRSDRSRARSGDDAGAGDVARPPARHRGSSRRSAVRLRRPQRSASGVVGAMTGVTTPGITAWPTPSRGRRPRLRRCRRRGRRRRLAWCAPVPTASTARRREAAPRTGRARTGRAGTGTRRWPRRPPAGARLPLSMNPSHPGRGEGAGDGVGVDREVRRGVRADGIEHAAGVAGHDLDVLLEKHPVARLRLVAVAERLPPVRAPCASVTIEVMSGEAGFGSTRTSAHAGSGHG